jgi:hypothetical protein
VKGAKERIGIFKAKQECDFGQFHGALFQIVEGEFPPRLLDELLKVKPASVRRR